jgi:hypothetical protein
VDELIKEHRLNDLISTLEWVNYQIADLQQSKEALEADIMKILNHDKDGSSTYTIGRYKIEIKTPSINKLDIKKYLSFKNKIPTGLDPVVEKKSYTISKKVLNDINEYATNDEKLFLSEFIITKPGKLTMKIGANV